MFTLSETLLVKGQSVFDLIVSIMLLCLHGLWIALYTVISIQKEKGFQSTLRDKSCTLKTWQLKPWLLYQITRLLTITKMIFFVESSAISYCPICGESLSYRDSCIRIMRLGGREETEIPDPKAEMQQLRQAPP